MLAKRGRRAMVARRRGRQSDRIADRRHLAELVVARRTSIWRAATCGSARAASIDRTRPQGTPNVSSLEMNSSTDHDVICASTIATRSERWRSRPMFSAKRGSSGSSGRSMARQNWTQSFGLPAHTITRPSRARKVSYGEMDGCWFPIRGGRSPVAKKMPAGNDIVARIASKSAMSTACPRPVRSRSRKASRMPANMNWPAR